MQRDTENLVEAVDELKHDKVTVSTAQLDFLGELESLINVVNMEDIRYNVFEFKRIYNNLGIYKGEVPEMSLERIPKTHRDLKKKLSSYFEEVAEFIEIEHLRNYEDADNLEVLLDVLKDFVLIEKLAIFEGDDVDHEQDLRNTIDNVPGLSEGNRNRLKEALEGQALQFFSDTLDVDVEIFKVYTYTGEKARKMFSELFTEGDIDSQSEDLIKGIQDTEKDFEDRMETLFNKKFNGKGNTFSISELRQSVVATPTAPTTPKKEAKNEKAFTSSMEGVKATSPNSRFGNSASKNKPFLERVSSAPKVVEKGPVTTIVPSTVTTNVTVGREQMVNMLNDMIDQGMLDIKIPKFSSRKRADAQYAMSVTEIQEDGDGNFTFLFEGNQSTTPSSTAESFEGVDEDDLTEYQNEDLEKLWKTDPDVSEVFIKK